MKFPTAASRTLSASAGFAVKELELIGNHHAQLSHPQTAELTSCPPYAGFWSASGALQW